MRAPITWQAKSVPFTFTCHHLVERLRRIVLERPDLLGRCVGRRVERRGVDEDVRDVRELRRRALDRAAIGDVDDEAADAVAFRSFSDVEDRDLRSARRQPARDLAAELAGAAGHDGDPAVEREEIGQALRLPHRVAELSHAAGAAGAREHPARKRLDLGPGIGGNDRALRPRAGTRRR